MNNKVRKLLSDFSYTISSNFISLLISTIVILVVPKLIGIREYGYWQLYTFYAAYVGIFHFGWNQGIYLKHGGASYQHLEKSHFSTQFYLLFSLELCIAILAWLISSFISNNNEAFILQMLAFSMILANLREFFLVLLQDTGRMKLYSIINISDRFFYVFLTILLLIFGIRDYKLLIVSDLIGKFISLLLVMYICSDLFFTKPYFNINSVKNSVEYISIGIKLLIATYASSFIIATIRYFIQMFWGVATFGKVSLVISISNLLLVFIMAISIVLYPILRRVQTDSLPKVYLQTRQIIMFIMICGLILYFPLKVFLPLWLPKYSDSIAYLSFLFPLCVYEGKFELLINTFMKTLRLEKELLYINVTALLMSIALSLMNIFLLKNIDLMIFQIVFVLALRSIISELYITYLLHINSVSKILEETFVVLIFISSTWFMSINRAFLIYLIVLTIFIFINYKKTYGAIQELIRI